MAGQLWGTSNLGGYMYSDQLSDILRTALQPMVRFRQFADIKEGKGLSKGDRLYWNVYSDVAAGASITGIAETDVVPETNFTVRQESLVVTEYANSVPFTKKLDDLSKHSVTEVIHKVLKNDARTALDGAAHAQFDLAPVTITPAETATPGTGDSATDVVFTNSTTPASLNGVALRADHIKAIGDGMKERNVTPFDGEHYMCIARPSTLRSVKNDLEGIYQYVDAGFQMIYNGEIGKYEGFRFVEQTSVASEGWSGGFSDAAYFFGADTVAEGVVTPEEIRGRIPTDYGRSRGIAWYYLGGFGLSHTDAANARVFKWASLEP